MEIPIQEAVFNEEDPRMGLKLISLVKNPATELMLVKLSEQQEIKLAIQDEEKMQFIVPVLVPYQMILRKDEAGNPFRLVFGPDTIEKIAYNWQLKNLSSKVDVEHSRQLIQGVNFCETFLTSEKTIPTVKGFEMLPPRTWFVVGRALTHEAWEPIKNGVVKGVSIDGVFDSQPVKMNDISDTIILNLIKKLYN